MTPLFKKLNFKDQQEIVVLYAPLSLSEELDLIKTYTEVKLIDKPCPFSFLLGFVTKQEDVAAMASRWCPKTIGDAIMWLAYPKMSSKKYKCDFNRDTGWQILGDLGWEPVKMIAIDEDWSALRFRKVDFIKKMTRSFAMTSAGKEKTKKVIS
jgi:hypothetical protein